MDHENKKLFIYQMDDYFKVTTDSVQLVNFINLRKKDKMILDIGSGIGTIPILLSTKTDHKIIGIEIQEKIAELSKKSILYNHLDQQIEIIIDKIQNYKKYFIDHSFDIIVSNPPYFKVEKHSILNQKKELTIARHEIELSFEDLARITHHLLKENGRFFFVHQSERLIEIIEILKKYDLEPKRIEFLYGTKNKNSILFLLEASYKGKSGLKIMKPNIIGEDKNEGK